MSGFDLSDVNQPASGSAGDASAANQAITNGLLNPTLVVEAVTADETIAAANYWHGYSLKNTSADTIVVLSVHNGDASNDPVIGWINLAGNESTGVVVFPKRIPCSDGIHFEVVSGAVTGVIYYEV